MLISGQPYKPKVIFESLASICQVADALADQGAWQPQVSEEGAADHVVSEPAGANPAKHVPAVVQENC